jgi:hypothetical protein
MEHSYIEDHHIADRYLAGKLSTEELMRFEEHFVDCAECIDRLRTVDEFRAGLRAVAAEDALRLRAYLQVERAGALALAARLIRKRPALSVAGVILLIALPIALLIAGWKGARRDLAQERQTSSEWRRKYEEGAQSARDLAKESQARERDLSLQRDRFAAEIEQMRKSTDPSIRPSREAAGYESEPPVFLLSVARGGGADLSEPVNRIALSPSSKLIVLLLELEPDPDIQSYRAVVLTADGRNVWTRNSLKPNSRNALALSFKTGLFKPADYRLTLEGLSAQEGRVPISTYAFRVLAGK